MFLLAPRRHKLHPINGLDYNVYVCWGYTIQIKIKKKYYERYH